MNRSLRTRLRHTSTALVLISAFAVLSACGGGSGSGGGENPPPQLVISTASLPSGQTGVAFRATLVAPRGTPSFLWTLTNGTLPTGLMLDGSAGTITGTPTQAVSNLMLTFQVADSGSPKQTKSVTLSLTITMGTLSVSISPKRAGLTLLQPLSVTGTVANEIGRAH